jgi:flagellar biogenesis protein FliO
MFKKIFALCLLSISLQAAPENPLTPPIIHPETIILEPPSSEVEAPSSANNNESYEHAFIKMILTLAGLLVLVFLTLWLLRKFSQGRLGGFTSSKKIKILEKKPLSPKTILYLVELDGKQVFIAESQLEVKMLLSPQIENED